MLHDEEPRVVLLRVPRKDVFQKPSEKDRFFLGGLFKTKRLLCPGVGGHNESLHKEHESKARFLCRAAKACSRLEKASHNHMTK